jgi:hypothetical protein
VLKGLKRELISVLNPADFNIRQAKTVIIFISLLIFFFVSGFYYFYRWDNLDEGYLIYAKHETDRRAYLDTQRKLLLIYLDRDVDGDYEGFQDVDYTTTPNPLLLERDRQAFAQMDELNDLSYKSVFNVTLFKQDKVLKELFVSNVVTNFLDNLIPPNLFGEERNESSSSWVQSMLGWGRYHDYFCMFYQPSLRNTRVVRWTSLMLTILLNLFVDTLFFGVFYPDTGSCESYTSSSDCLQYSNMATDDSVCQWSTADNTCSPNPPPSTYVYVVVVVMMTLIVSVPMGFLYEVVIWQYCVRRPKIKGWSWFSYSKNHTTDLFNSPGALSPLSELFASIDEDRAVGGTDDVGLSSSYESDEVESARLLHLTRQLLHEYTTTANIPWKKETSSSRHSQHHQQQQLAAIQEHLGFYPDGSAVPLSLWDKIWYGDAERKLLSRVRAARSNASSIREELLRLGKDEQFQRDNTLMELFILEQFSSFKQFCLSKQMFQFSLVQALPIHASQWFLATAFIVLSIAFFFYWILLWGVTEGGHSLQSWGLNFGLSILQDVVFIQPVRIYLIYILSMSSIKPQLRCIYRVLSRVAMRCALNDDERPTTKLLTVVQHLSPACRAAHFNEASDLAAARILRSVNDVDKDDCNAVRNRLSAVALLLLFIPVLFGLLDRSFGDILFKSILPGIPAVVLLITYYFYQAAGLYFIIVYAVVLLITIAVFWRWSMVVSKISTIVTAAASGQSIYWNAVDSSSLRVSPNNYLSMLRNSVMSIVQFCWQTSVVDSSAEAWKLFNFPYHLQAEVVPSSASVLDERSQHGLQLLSANPPLSDLIPTEIMEMTKDILWSPADRLNSSNYIGELLQASSSENDTSQRLTGNTFDGAVAKQRAAAFQRKNMTIDSAMSASRMILTNYQALLTYNEVTLVDPSEHMTMFTASDPSDCEVMVSMNDLSKLLREIWSSYHPFGKQLDIHQIDEVCESFREWIVIHGQRFFPQVDSSAFTSTDICVRFEDFHQWFLERCESIERTLMEL